MKANKISLPKVGDELDGCKVVEVISTTAIPRIVLRPLSTYPVYKFKVEIRISKNKLVKQYYAVIKGKNGEIVFTGELRKSRYGLVKTIKNLLPNVEISNAK